MNTNTINFTAFDFETANRHNSSVCALGMAMVREGKVVDTKYWLVKPTPSHFDGINISIHGIRPVDVQDAPTFGELWSELQPYFEGTHLVAHNAAFDIGVLKGTLSAYDINFPNCYYYCSMYSAKKILPDLPKYRLNMLAAYYGITINHHHAESDAIACAQVMINLCEKIGAHSLENLLQIQNWRLGQLTQAGEHTSYSTAKRMSKKRRQ
ncbi:MAG: 3'-5' exonuclease [Flammeovirgaceae bacterium]